jgi:hypothetical protein
MLVYIIYYGLRLRSYINDAGGMIIYYLHMFVGLHSYTPERLSLGIIFFLASGRGSYSEACMRVLLTAIGSQADGTRGGCLQQGTQ